MTDPRIGTQNIRYERTPTGVRATLTATLPGGHVEVFTAEITDDEVGFLSGIGKALKAVGGKVMGVASKGLAIASTVLPPQYAIPAKAASAALGVGAKLTAARVAPKAKAAAIVASAKADAKRLTKTPAGMASLLKVANTKSTKATAIAAKSSIGKEGDLIARARAGRVRSNRGGAVSQAALLKAHRAGRVFWVS